MTRRLATRLPLLGVALLAGCSLAAPVDDDDSAVGPTVVLNELLADNVAALSDAADPDHPEAFDDWLELFAPGAAQQVGGWYLTDAWPALEGHPWDPSDPRLWRLPEDAEVPAGGHLLIWADDDVEQGALHAPFKLGAGGETVALLTPDGAVVDVASFGPQEPDRAWGRLGDGGALWVAQPPTPDTPNPDPSPGA